MTFYLAIAGLLFLLAFARLCGAVDARYERALVLWLTLPALALSCLRWETGTDWTSYIEFFRSITTLADANAQNWWGPGYAYLAVLVNSVGASYTVFLLVIALLLFGAKLLFITRACAAPLVAVFVLFCGNFYDIYFVRQDVAVIFFFGFVYYYFHRRYMAASCAAVLALAFHYSAVVPIALVILLVRFGWKKILVVGAFSVVVGYLIVNRLAREDLLTLAPALSYFGTGYVEEKASGLSTTLRAYIKILFLLVVVAVGYIWLMQRTRQESAAEWSEFCLRSALVILVLSGILLPFSEIAARIPPYTLPLFAVILANYQFRIRQFSVVSAIYLCLLLSFLIELAFLYSAYPDAYYPIKTILN
jgi:hypothetical protein